jgi:hypothetical protein
MKKERGLPSPPGATRDGGAPFILSYTIKKIAMICTGAFDKHIHHWREM